MFFCRLKISVFIFDFIFKKFIFLLRKCIIMILSVKFKRKIYLILCLCYFSKFFYVVYVYV